ncbi:MAG: VCBS repeat-containing protein [Armatimonadetes bacterium]|nr:VCBS repeat-containing protein [Armatimonadota bacterium]
MLSLLLSLAARVVADAPAHPAEHPLLPGIRCPEVWNRDWPRVMHDKQLTGFSPLPLGMKTAPTVWAKVDVGGELSWARAVKTHDGRDLWLVNDGPLRLIDPDGTVLWTSDEWGYLSYFGDLRGNGRDYLLLATGTRLSIVNGETGKTEWVRSYEPAWVNIRPAVGDILPDRPGLEVAVFCQYGEEGYLFQVPPEGDPVEVWRKTVVVPGEHPERYDHGCDIRLDFSDPARPVIWNVRHHRCRGLDARTGEILSSLVYSIGPGHQRNYGPWAMGRDRDGKPIICVVAEAVQQHVEGIRLHTDRPCELAWNHYYGEVYLTPGVSVQNLAIADLDGDGALEMAYNVHDPAEKLRAFIRVRDGGTGTLNAELPDAVATTVFRGVGPEKVSGLVVRPEPDNRAPAQRSVKLYRFVAGGGLKLLAEVPRGSVWGPVTAPGAEGNDLLLLVTGAKGGRRLVRYTLRGDTVKEASASSSAALTATAPVAVVSAAGPPAFLTAGQGKLERVGWDGKRAWELPLVGGSPPLCTAGDLNGDGRAELVASCAGNRVRVFSFAADGKYRELWNREFVAPRERSGPLLYDLANDGKLCVVAPGRSAAGRLCVRAYRGDGSLLWATELPNTTADDGGSAVAWNAGEFLPGPRAGLAISFVIGKQADEGTFLLEGKTGHIVWEKRRYQDGTNVRGVRPMGLPTAFDYDGDGVEEVGMDMYSYMAWLRGTDGSFAFLQHTNNLGADGALYAAALYNSYVPVYQTPEAKRPHWFVPLGWGVFGLMNPDPTTGIWREDDGYDTPAKVGLIDVDGDGQLEVGYTVAHDPVFKCRDLWTGRMKWELKLSYAPGTPVLVADADGDGKGEFITGPFCIGTDAAGQGVLKWTAPTAVSWASIADFDGDGQGEMTSGWRGKVYVLKGQ